MSKGISNKLSLLEYLSLNITQQSNLLIKNVKEIDYFKGYHYEKENNKN